MKALVVYESMYGNTAAVAELIAAGLRTGCEVDVVRASADRPPMFDGASFVAFGAPTHGRRMPTDASRRQTVLDHGLDLDLAGPSMRELLKLIGTDASDRRPFAAAFDTRRTGPRWLIGAAAPGIARRLRRAGFPLLAAPESFLVSTPKGPLCAGERERATAWAEDILRALALGVSARPQVGMAFEEA